LSTIQFKNVSKSFGEQAVLKNFSMQVDSGEMKIILGGSGSGKSTILKLALGLVRPDSGRILIDDQDIGGLQETELMPIRGQIGMVFQAGALFDSLTVGENVAFRLREQELVEESEIKKAVLQMLGFVGLEKAVDKTTSELSGGMKRRVAIARALVGNPRMMFYDEPTAGLDPITSRAICELMMRLRDLDQASSIFVTHDLKAAMTISSETAVKTSEGMVVFKTNGKGASQKTRFVMLAYGTTLFEGTGEDLRKTNDEYIREFLD
jgi:phospholipid/cholesterol/gamma-HCH transport system ATP-binding protein